MTAPTLWTREERELTIQEMAHQVKTDPLDPTISIGRKELSRILATVDALEASLERCAHRLRNQGGGIGEITHSINMLAVTEAEALLAQMGEEMTVTEKEK